MSKSCCCCCAQQEEVKIKCGDGDGIDIVGTALCHSLSLVMQCQCSMSAEMRFSAYKLERWCDVAMHPRCIRDISMILEVMYRWLPRASYKMMLANCGQFVTFANCKNCMHPDKKNVYHVSPEMKSLSVWKEQFIAHTMQDMIHTVILTTCTTCSVMCMVSRY